MTAAPTARAAGRGWAYIALVLGGGLSIAANVAHTYLAEADPDALAVAVSIFWPAAVFVAVELLARVAWPAGRGWAALRYAGLLPVALVAAVVSYRHLSGLLEHYGEDAVTVALGPIAVDGLMVMATGALLATGRRAPATAAEVPATVAPATVTAPAASTSATVPAMTAPATVEEADRPATVPTSATANGHRPRPTSPRPRRTATPKTATATADDMAAKVAALLAERPTATAEEVAEVIGRAPRTARRYLASVRSAMTAPAALAEVTA